MNLDYIIAARCKILAGCTITRIESIPQLDAVNIWGRKPGNDTICILSTVWYYAPDYADWLKRAS